MRKQKMPKPNEALADFFSDNRIFADLFNAFAFQGQEVLKAEELQMADTSYMLTAKRAEGMEKIGRYRDIIRKSALGTNYVILGIEDQNKVHHAMPVRTMLYDALEYAAECRSLGVVQDRTDWTVDEYLSGLAKGTSLTPVFTLVFYTGEDPWDGPRTLYDMLPLEERLKPFIPNYTINLIDAGHLTEELPFHTKSLRELFHVLSVIYSGSGSSDQTVCYQSCRNIDRFAKII